MSDLCKDDGMRQEVDSTDEVMRNERLVIYTEDVDGGQQFSTPIYQARDISRKDS